MQVKQNEDIHIKGSKTAMQLQGKLASARIGVHLNCAVSGEKVEFVKCVRIVESLQ